MNSNNIFFSEKASVSIIMGSTSDMSVMEKPADFFDSFEIFFLKQYALSAHNVLSEDGKFVTNTLKNRYRSEKSEAVKAVHLSEVIS